MFLPLKISLPKNKTTVNLKSASFVLIMLVHEGLTHIQSQINPRSLFEFHFKFVSTAGELSNDVATVHVHQTDKSLT